MEEGRFGSFLNDNSVLTHFDLPFIYSPAGILRLVTRGDFSYA